LLSFPKWIEDGLNPSESDSAQKPDNLKLEELLEYAATYWVHHAPQGDASDSEMVLKFLSNSADLNLKSSLRFVNEYVWGKGLPYGYTWPGKIKSWSGKHVAACFGFVGIMYSLDAEERGE
jgi:hypothetical protein